MQQFTPNQYVQGVIVKDGYGNTLFKWNQSFACSIRIVNEGNRLVIEKQGLWNTETYIPSLYEAVEILK